MAGLGDPGEPQLAEEGEQHLADELVFGALVEVGRQLLTPFHFRWGKRPVRVWRCNRVRRDVAEMTLPARSVERLEAFPPQGVFDSRAPLWPPPLAPTPHIPFVHH